MNKNKKGLAVLSSAALGVLIASAVSSTASAKTTDYVAKDATGKVISFNLDKLVADYTNNMTGIASPMFDEYMKDAKNLVAFQDDKKGLVSYDAVLQVYVDAMASGKPFVLDTVTEAATDAQLAKDVTVGYACDEKGAVNSVDLTKVVKSVSAITGTTTIGVVPTLPTTVNVTLGDGTTKAANITWGTAATSTATYATAGTVTVNGTLADYNNYAVSATVTVNSQLAVQSVTAPNAKTLIVTFNGPVAPANTGTGALNLANYSVNGKALTDSSYGASPNIPVITKSDDNKTITIDFSKSSFVMTNDTSYAVVVSGIKSQDLTKDVPMYTQALTFSDTVSPTATLSYNSAIQAKINFSEPMSTKGTVKVYDAQGNDVTASFTVNNLATDAKSFTIDMGSSVVNGVDYTAKIVGASDLAGNLVNPNPATFTIRKTVTDTTKPTISSIKANSSNQVVVTYNKKVSNPGTLSCGGATAMTIDTTANTGNATVDSTGTIYTITLDAANATAVKTAGIYNTIVAGYVDMNGNTGDSSTSVVSYQGDTTGPAYVSQSVVDIAGTKCLVVNFDSAVTVASPADATATFVDSNGIQSSKTVDLTTAGNVALYNPTGASSTKSIAIKLAAFPASGSYTFTLPSNTVTDNVGNKNDDINMTFIKDDATGDTTAPTVDTTYATSPFAAGYAIQQADNNTIEVRFSEALDKATALDVNNYLIDNQVVAKSVVFDTNTQTVKITLNDGAVSIDGSHLFTIRNVKDVAGNAMKTITTTQTFKENIAPTIKSAALTGTDSITITFSENVKSSTASTGKVDKDDFDVYIDGVLATQDTATSSITDAVAGNTITLKLHTPLSTAADLAKTITIKKSASNDVVDADGNAEPVATITVSK